MDSKAWCACSEGYELQADGRTCEDVDECTSGTDDCAPFQSCRNTAGYHECRVSNCTHYFRSHLCCRPSTTESCGDAGTDGGNTARTRRAVSSVGKSSVDQWPWVVYIAKYRHIKEPEWCTGTFVSQSTIITAYHCVTQWDVENSKPRVIPLDQIGIWAGVNDAYNLTSARVPKLHNCYMTNYSPLFLVLSF